MSRLSLYLLGSPRVERDGLPVQIRRRKAIALLAYLAVTGRAHSRDALATLLWPEQSQSRARAGLRTALADIRAAVGEGCLEADRETVGLVQDPAIELDVRAFRDRLADCRAHDHVQSEGCAACLGSLAEAAALYGDDFLAGFTLPDSPAFDEWQFFESQGLRDELAFALEQLARTHGARGEHEQAIAYGRRWVALDPLHEAAQRCLMRRYAQAGQRAAALRQYEACAQVLQAELGVPPSEETAALYQAIVEGREQAAAEPKAGRYRFEHLINLPVQLTPFVGRERELAIIGAKLGDPDCRLLTLTGPGGVGKTRLALEAAAALVDAFHDGVWFVPLAPLQSADGILPAVAHALSFDYRRVGDPQRQLLDHLSESNMLLVLDNLEHLLDGADGANGADLVAEMLRAAPEVRILATSRARLNVHGEHVLTLEGMDYPVLSPGAGDENLVVPSRQVPGAGKGRDAPELFLASARRAQPDLALTEDDLARVAEICRLVEGLPLAIVLAAGWVSALSPAEIAAEIRQSLDILETDMRGIPAEGAVGGERHRSIRAVFGHSWSLLSEREREVFRGLSVFRGSFTRLAARQVAGASLRELMALVNKSLLQHVSRERYQVHELLRRYGTERLDETPDGGRAVRDRHCGYYTGVVEAWGAGQPFGSLWTATVAEMDVEIENARAAWDWALAQGDVGQLDRSAEGLCRCYNRWRRREEGITMCQSAAERLLSMASDEMSTTVYLSWNSALARILAWQGLYSLRLGGAEPLAQPERARQLLARSVEAASAVPSSERETWAEGTCVFLRMGMALARAREAGQPAALLLGDIDDFRRVNNTYGHQTGDVVLWGVARLFQEGVEGRGVFGRPGGEEFVGLLPGVDEEQALAVADRVRQRVQDAVFQSVDGRDVRATISVGVALCPGDAVDLVSLYQLADHAAHQAKRMGKNWVLCASEGEG
jgi:diguanylate cyclase (GGDEF)-like protein